MSMHNNLRDGHSEEVFNFSSLIPTHIHGNNSSAVQKFRKQKHRDTALDSHPDSAARIDYGFDRLDIGLLPSALRPQKVFDEPEVQLEKNSPIASQHSAAPPMGPGPGREGISFYNTRPAINSMNLFNTCGRNWEIFSASTMWDSFRAGGGSAHTAPNSGEFQRVLPEPFRIPLGATMWDCFEGNRHSHQRLPLDRPQFNQAFGDNKGTLPAQSNSKARSGVILTPEDFENMRENGLRRQCCMVEDYRNGYMRCGEWFSDPQKASRHLVDVHGLNCSKGGIRVKESCVWGSCKIVSKSMHRHILETHFGTKYQCPVAGCNMHFARFDQVKKHVRLEISKATDRGNRLDSVRGRHLSPELAVVFSLHPGRKSNKRLPCTWDYAIFQEKRYL